jgi:hypothetical protein
MPKKTTSKKNEPYREDRTTFILDKKPFETDKPTHALLEKTRKDWNLPSKTAVIRQAIMVANRAGMIPIASIKNTYANTRPIIITGDPGSGKTTIVKELLTKPSHIIVIDVNGEYSDTTLPGGKKFHGLKKLPEGKFFNINYKRPGKYRIVPHPSEEVSQSQINVMLMHLNRIKLEGFDPNVIPSGILKDWVFVIEESQRFIDLKSFTSFVIEARKVTKKVIIVSTNYKALEGLAPIYRPREFDQK